MQHRYSFLLVFPFLFSAAVLYLLLYDDLETTSINAVIGDESYIQIYGEEPDEQVSDFIRIQVHLHYVESILRNRPADHLTKEQKKNRSIHLDLLNQYTFSGDFPHNDGHPDHRRPTFISSDGKICAVGYLVKKTAGKEVAEAVNEQFKYAYISEIDHPAFLEWVETSGFTIEELAMIQPAYGPIVVEETESNSNKINRSYGIGSTLLTGANALYLSNNSANPWMFDNPSTNHWFGLVSGTASITLGAVNFGKTRTYTEQINPDETMDPNTGFCMMGCRMREVTETNHARLAVSAANIGIGVFSVIRAGYHLMNRSEEKAESQSGLGVTQIMVDPLNSGETVPVLSYSVHF